MSKNYWRIHLQKNEIDKVVNLFYLVWGGTIDRINSKTQWAFNHDKSKVLLFKDSDDNITCVRGGFEWPLVIKNKLVSSYQLHGTCVHPQHRRQGLFSKLTKTFVEEAQNEGKKIIFNVSVKNSRLGYEKLGWKYIKGFRRLTKVHLSTFFFKKEVGLDESEIFENVETMPTSLFHKRERHFHDFVHTKYTKDFLKWRLSNEKENYRIIRIDGSYLIYKMQNKGRLREMVIGDAFLDRKSSKVLRSLLCKAFKIEKPHLSTIYLFNTHPYYFMFIKNVYVINLFNFNLNFGIKLLDNTSTIPQEKFAFSFLDIDTF